MCLNKIPGKWEVGNAYVIGTLLNAYECAKYGKNTFLNIVYEVGRGKATK